MALSLLPNQRIVDLPKSAQKHRKALIRLAIASIALASVSLVAALFIFADNLIWNPVLGVLAVVGGVLLVVTLALVCISSAIVIRNMDKWVSTDVCCNLMRSWPTCCTRSCASNKKCCARLSSTHIAVSVTSILLCALSITIVLGSFYSSDSGVCVSQYNFDHGEYPRQLHVTSNHSSSHPTHGLSKSMSRSNSTKDGDSSYSSYYPSYYYDPPKASRSSHPRPKPMPKKQKHSYSSSSYDYYYGPAKSSHVSHPMPYDTTTMDPKTSRASDSWTSWTPECYGADINEAYASTEENCKNDCAAYKGPGGPCLFVTWGNGRCTFKNGRTIASYCHGCGSDGYCKRGGPCNPATSYCSANRVGLSKTGSGSSQSYYGSGSGSGSGSSQSYYGSGSASGSGSGSGEYYGPEYGRCPLHTTRRECDDYYHYCVWTGMEPGLGLMDLWLPFIVVLLGLAGTTAASACLLRRVERDLPAPLLLPAGKMVQAHVVVHCEGTVDEQVTDQVVEGQPLPDATPVLPRAETVDDIKSEEAAKELIRTQVSGAVVVPAQNQHPRRTPITVGDLVS